jgi:hypothetical protein
MCPDNSGVIEQVLACGVERLGFVPGEPELPALKERVAALRKTMERHQRGDSVR